MTADQALTKLKKDPQNQDAWAVIFGVIYDPLIAYVVPVLLSFRVEPGETANDVVHDVLLNFYRRWNSGMSNISSLAELQAYLRRSCRNLLIDHYRQQRNAEQMINFLTLSFSSAFGSQADAYRSIFVQEIISLLPSECAALLRRYVETDLTPAEMADLEGAPPNTFYSRWYRCINRAKDIFSKRGRGTN